MNKPTIRDAGRFNRLLSIENEVEISDGCGGFVKQFEAQGTLWAHLCPVSASQSERADKLVSEITHRIWFRFRLGITTATRFVTGARKFQVIAVHDPDETRRYLQCDCVERK